MSRTPNKFEQSAIELMESLSSHAAIALDNARAFHESQIHSDRQKALRELTQDLTGSLNLETLFPRICKNLCHLLNVVFAELFLLDEKTETLSLAASLGKIKVQNFIKVFSKGEGLVQRIASQKIAVTVADVMKDPDWLDREFAEQAGFRSFLGVPLILHDRVVGTLGCFTDQLREFRAEEIELMQAFAAHAAAALENARLHSDLVSSEEKYRTLFENAQDGIEIVDEEGRYIDCNQKGCDLLGYTREELVGRPVADYLASESRDSFPQRIAQILKTGSQEPYEAINLRKDGTPVHLEIAAGVIELKGQKHVLFFLRDITERKEIDRMKNEFISLVSHEIRTPLTSLRGSLGLLAGGVVGELQPQGQELLRIAVNNCDRLIRLVNDILDLEKIEAGKMELHIAPHSVEALVNRAIEEMQGFADEQGVWIETGLEPCEVKADGDRAVQVLTNLLSNAIKFSDSGSGVTIGARCTDGEAEIRVTDRGRGIPATAQESIFDKFQQVDASDSRQKGGTGLGLAICRAIVNQHGGRIWVESEEGVGSTFFFTLPRTRPVPEPAVRAGPPERREGEDLGTR